MTIVDEVPASIGQRLVWFLEHYRSQTSVSCPAVFRIRGELAEDRLPPVLAALVARHEALRTTLRRQGRGLVQRIHDLAPTRLPAVDLDPGAEAELTRQLTAELTSTLPIGESPVRFRLWRLGTADRVLCVNMHHLISDAWSCGVVISDVIALLAGPGRGQAPAPAPVGWQFRQFARWQHELARTGQLRAQQEHWQRRLAGMALPALPGRPGRPDGARPSPALATATLTAGVGDGLRALAGACRTTLFSVYLALYFGLLHRETGQADLAVASFFANRTRPELHRTVGFLANMLALRTAFDPDGSFRELVGHTRSTVLDAVTHQAVPCQLLSLPSLLHATSRLNDVVFQMLPDRSPESWDPTPLAPGVEIDTFRPPQALSRFGLNLTIIPRRDRTDARLSYADNQFPAGWAESFLAGYGSLAAAALREPDRPLAELLRELAPHPG
jgi:hypothetical protein